VLVQAVWQAGLVCLINRRDADALYAACYLCHPSSQIEEMVEVPVVLELASDLLDRRCPIFRCDDRFCYRSAAAAQPMLPAVNRSSACS
jgi:hypothetical protein